MTRPLNSKFLIDEDRPVFVYYCFQIQLSLLLSSATVSLAIYDAQDNETIIATSTHAYIANLGTLYIQLNGFVPAGYEVQLKKSGTGTVTVATEQEVIG